MATEQVGISDNIVSATIAESRDKPNKKHVLARLRDWQARVHALYDAVQKTLGSDYAYDRSGNQESAEDMVQRVRLDPAKVPKLDILRIEQDGKAVATFVPRGLWIIGANGRVDVIITPRSGGRRLFMLIDHSLPLSSESDWRIVRPSDQLHQPPFLPERFGELLE
jgi:hypothetical protein